MDCNGKIVPAMPKDMFAHKLKVLQSVKYFNEQPRDYYEQSVVAKYTVNTIPPKIDMKEFPEFKEQYTQNAHKLNIVHPKKLIDSNIGSNRGLIAILKKIWEEYKSINGGSARYMTLNVDENIYYRILKVRV